MGSSGRGLRASFGAVLFSSLVWFLLIDTLANQAPDHAATRISSTRKFNIFALISGGKHYLPRGRPIYYSVSKRRVRNGPDPIHNRRAGTSRVPSTRA